MLARRIAVFAALAACAFAAAALAQGEADRDAAESREVLEKSCRDEGRDAAICSCLGDFVTENFTEREMAGAALVFSDPLFTTDPAAGIGALLSAGYTLEEITAVVERVVALETEATEACSVEAAPAG